MALAAVACGGAEPAPLAAPSPVAEHAPTGAPEQVGDAAADSQIQANSEGTATESTREDETALGLDSDADDSRAPQTRGDTSAEKRATQVPGKKPAAPEPNMDAIDVTATLEPTCVERGGKVTITVTAVPDASVGYHAFYSDGKGGGPPPFGASYGGNSGGIAGEQGRYQDSWTVSANAPSGSGHVDVIAGTPDGFGETRVSFAVADAIAGKCD